MTAIISETIAKEKIWLSSPHMGGGEQKYVTEAFDTNWVAPLGPNVNGLEADLQSYIDNDVYVTSLSSGTAALHLSLILLGVKQGDEVLCQSMTFSASANPITYVGATPVFVDSEELTWNICPILLEEAILDRITKGKKPKAIIAVHLYGMPYQVEAINAISMKYEIPVIEDSAEALGSHYNNKNCGGLGALSILSFNGNKIITTSGGGALISKDKRMNDKALFLATQARDKAPHYQHSEIGYNYRMSNILAGIGRGQMEVIDDRVKARRANHSYYLQELSNTEEISFLEEPEGYFSNRWLTAIKTDSFKTRELLREELQKDNIESRPLWKPMHMQPVFEKAFSYNNGVSENLFDTGLCLPSGSNLKEKDLERVVSIIKTVLG